MQLLIVECLKWTIKINAASQVAYYSS